MSYFPEIVDNTMRAAYVRCPTSFKREFIDGLNTMDDHWDLHAGKSFASGTEAARRAYFIHGHPYAQCIEAGRAAVREAWGTYTPPKSLYKFKTLDRMIGAIDFYFSKWPFEEDGYTPYILNGTTPMIETPMLFPLAANHPISGKPLRYSIRPDFAAQERGTGRLVVVDDKTAGKLSDDFAAKYDLDAQLTGYMWGVKKATLAPAIDAEVRGIGILKNEYGAVTASIYKPQWLLDAWFKQVNRDFMRMVEDYKSGFFSQAFDDACNPYGRSCDYKPLCLSTNPERLIDGNYKIAFWNPATRERK